MIALEKTKSHQIKATLTPIIDRMIDLIRRDPRKTMVYILKSELDIWVDLMRLVIEEDPPETVLDEFIKDMRAVESKFVWSRPWCYPDVWCEHAVPFLQKYETSNEPIILELIERMRSAMKCPENDGAEFVVEEFMAAADEAGAAYKKGKAT